MPITRIELIPYALPLRRAWRSHHGSLHERRGWLVCVHSDGLVGRGDCAPMPAAGTEDHTAARDCLHSARAHWPGRRPAQLLDELGTDTTSCPAARCGLETALIDLLAQRAGTSIAGWLNPTPAPRVRVNANLGCVAAATGAQIHALHDYHVIKLKLGCAPLGAEIAALQQLATTLHTGTNLRLDANGAWTARQAAYLLDALSGLPIESLEEPLAEPDRATLHRLQGRTDIPLALDESIGRFEPTQLLTHCPVRRLILKPMARGGLRPALALARQAHTAGIQTIVTTTVDSAVGVWAAVHLAAALGATGQHQSHGLATSDWLAQDIAVPPRIHAGMIALA